MTLMTRWAGISAVLLGVGCTHLSPPVRMDAAPADMEALVGKWSGEYSGDGVNARHGSISFILAAGEDHAHGDVLMIPAGSKRAYERYRGGEPTTPVRDFPQPPEVLSIRFVRAVNGAISGTLDPYWDPDRQCQAWTTFRGYVIENTIQGTFASTYARPLAEATGHWRVERAR